MRLSVITINFNNKNGLEQTAASLFKQSYKDYEYIIIDGGSTDGSKELVDLYSAHTSWSESAPDNGIYNAMNKGIAKATGEYLLFLNSGDYLHDEKVLENLFAGGNEADIIYGNIILDDGQEQVIGVFPAKLLFSYFFNASLPHACSVIRRSLFDEVGLYDEQYKIVSDWAFFLLAINKFQCSYQYVPMPVTVFNLDGISAKEGSQEIIKREREEVLRKHFSSFMPEYESQQKLKEEMPRLKGMLGYRVHNKLNRLYRRLLRK